MTDAVRSTRPGLLVRQVVDGQPVLRAVLLAGLYFAARFFLLGIFAEAGGGVPMWPSFGVGLAALLVYGMRLWPLFYLAIFGAYAAFGQAWVTGRWEIPAMLAALETLHLVLAAHLVNRMAGGVGAVRSRHGLSRFWLVVLCTSVWYTAVFMLITLNLGWIQLQGPVWLLLSWAGSTALLPALGAAIVAPVLLLWLRPEQDPVRRGAGESVALAVSVLVVCAGLLGARYPLLDLPLVFLCLPLAAWAAIRFGKGTTVAVVLTVTVAMMGGSLLGHNVFAPGPIPTVSTAVMQFYVLALAAFASLLAVFAGDLRQSLAKLAATRDDLQAANKELEAFAYSVSHDLRAPLRSMDGYSRILLEEAGPALDSTMRHHLDMIVSSAGEMGQMVDDLLAFSRLGKQPLATKPVEPEPLVRNVLADLRPLREGRSVDIQVGPLPACRADPGLLRQVYANLIGNALKYTRARPEAKIDVGWDQDGDAYFVRDNGVGFDMMHAGRLFGVFQRLHRAEDYEGTGVGLAIAQRIVQRHGGRIWADAALGKGATFFFTIPPTNGDETHGP